ncbi:uncharacterized protein KIAA1614 homolog isoform X2 [Pelodiscus sinensis]|uniref:uncharacterized protein KIAA1614 homolog isoform X2 n=1 Tax=Pelodiscus sinensis TaxID=13735 RepID=UPI003F6BF0ED
MEGSSPTEKRRAGKGAKHSGRNAGRSHRPAESTGTSRSQPARAALEPAGLPGEPGGAACSILEGKVKALKEQRLSMKQGGAVSQERAPVKKPKARKGRLVPGLAVAEGVPQDTVVEPRAQIRTYLTDVLLDSRDDGDCGQGAGGAVAADLYTNHVEALEAHGAAGGGSPLGHGSAGELWRLPSPGRHGLENTDGRSENRVQRGYPCGLQGPRSTRNPATSSQKSAPEARGTPASSGEELCQAGDLESTPQDGLYGGPAPPGRLWRAESWESLGSAASATSGLSLAERVERNRVVLQEMLRPARQNRSAPPPRHHEGVGADLPLAKDGAMQELPGNDLDWDSGISLPDSEGCRAFVPAPELELSPRHEQAKQLLQRARMKARTSPLRASHDILPAAAQARREAGGRAAPDLKGCALKDGEAQAGGNLSDSSSGESSCGQPRKRGPSPSRVRFEDESLRDAEVRYLERLHVRQKRVLDSVLQTLGQSPLLSKPDLADYVNGDFPRQEHGGSRACREQQALGLARRGRSETAALSAEGKCRACGSYLGGSAANPRADARPDRALKHLPESHGATQENPSPGEPSAPQQEARGRTLGPRGSPLWILPSRQRVHTERIRETYIGAVTYIDEVDSALDSTDTSDSCRTDSEEAGPGSSQPKSYQEARGCRPGGHQAPRGALEQDTRGRRAGQEERRANGGRAGAGLSDRTLGPGRAGDERNSSLKETLVPQEGQVSRVSANGAEALSEGHRLPAAAGLAGTKDQGEAALAPMQGRYAHPPPPAQGHLSAPPEATVPSHRGALESSAPAPPPAPNVSQPRPATGISRHHAMPGAPPAGGAASPVPSRRAVLTGSCRLPGHGTGSPEQPRDQVAQPAPPPSKPGSVPEELRSQRSPRALAKAGLRALSTNNCNNTRATPQHGGQAAPSPGERARKGQEPPASWDENRGLPSAAARAAAPSAVSSAGITLSLAATEPSPAQAQPSPSGAASGAGSHQAKRFAAGSCRFEAEEPAGLWFLPSHQAAGCPGGAKEAIGLSREPESRELFRLGAEEVLLHPQSEHQAETWQVPVLQHGAASPRGASIPRSQGRGHCLL